MGVLGAFLSEPGTTKSPPFQPTSSAWKASRSAPSGATIAWMRQNSVVLNARISSSRSATRRTATDCTRPADSPFVTFFHRKGERR